MLVKTGFAPSAIFAELSEYEANTRAPIFRKSARH
jgi:hypothetical protein